MAATRKEKPAFTLPEGLPTEMVSQLPEPDAKGLRFTLRKATITLPTGIEAQLLVQPEKQQPPSSGDGISAAAFLYLPKNDSWQFGERLTLFGEKTTCGWGWGTSPENPNQKYGKKGHLAQTWLAALQAAEAYCLTELLKLWNALETRLKALHSEGEEYFIAHKSGLSKSV